MLNIPGREMHWFESIDSTMRAAARLAFQGCASGTVVAADEQTEGQGRFGRAWHSEKGAGIYASIVLRTPLEPEALPAATLALGLATAAAIETACGVACDLRWPNDVLVDGKKVAGVLLHVVDEAIVAGIGINVNHKSLPGELAGQATSLRIATGREHSRELLLAELLESVDTHMDILGLRGRSAVLDMFARKSSFVAGRCVEIEEGPVRVQGTTEGLNESGFLILRKQNGERKVILTGGVRPCS